MPILTFRSLRCSNSNGLSCHSKQPRLMVLGDVLPVHHVLCPSHRGAKAHPKSRDTTKKRVSPASRILGTENRKRAEYCFESTVSEKRTQWALGHTRWVLRKTRWVRVYTQIIGWEELTQFAPRNSVSPKKLTEFGVWNRSLRNRIRPVSEKRCHKENVWQRFCQTFPKDPAVSKILRRINSQSPY